MTYDPQVAAAIGRLVNRAAHDGGWWSPLGPRRLRALLSSLELSRSDAILDIGAGTCELIVRIVERFGCRGVAIDNYPGFTSSAQARIPRALAKRLAVHEIDAAEYTRSITRRRFKLAVCVGAQNIFGQYADMLGGLAPIIRNRGQLLIGYSTRKHGPDQQLVWREYHRQCVRVGERYQLTPVRDWVASDAEWRGYHASLQASLARLATAMPTDPDVQLYRAAIGMFEQQLADIRRTTSFGFVLYAAS